MNLLTHPVVVRADEFAAYAHRNQLRKTGGPYIVHPRRVAQVVSEVPGATYQMVAAALLHDVVEDTDITLSEIAGVFGLTIASMVLGLTSQFKDPSLGNRHQRAMLEAGRLSQQPAEVQTVKAGDILSNAEGLSALPTSFVQVYIPEKLHQLDMLYLADPGLVSRARSLLV